jgi:putative transposase
MGSGPHLFATKEGFLYLSLITDKCSRKIVGYHCDETLEASGCLAALEKALADLPAGRAPIHHSDRGGQYCRHRYLEKLGSRGLQVSMTETNHVAENAMAERVNGILKGEYGLGYQFQTKEQALRAVEQAVYLYNSCRPHRALGYQFPSAVHSLVESSKAGYWRPPTGSLRARHDPRLRVGERLVSALSQSASLQ